MLYIFVEGYFDELFFTKTYFTEDTNKFIQYSSQKPEKVNAFIKSIKKMPTCDYLFFADGDGQSINDKTNVIISEYSEVERNKVFIVQYEIESWYYAGVCESNCKKLKLNKFEFTTNNITKEALVAKMPKPSERQFIMSKMLDFFEEDIASARNTSFKIFTDYIKEPIAAV